MKRLASLMLAAMCAASAVSAGQYCFEIKSTNDIAALVAALPKWEAGKGTNGVTISTCIGIIDCGHSANLLFRDMVFDCEGRLVRVSEPHLGEVIMAALAGAKFKSFEEVAKSRQRSAELDKRIMRSLRGSRRTPAQPTPPRQSARPCDGEI